MREYLRSPLPTNLKDRIRRNFEQRSSNWLEVLRRVVFADHKHPYSRMFQLANCAYEDVADAVNKNGLEPTLEHLRRIGVYLDHDELKGKTPLIRSGQEIPAPPGSFTNPLPAGWLKGSSGGSRSAGTVTSNSTAHLSYLAGYASLNVEEFQLERGPYVIVRPTLPSIAGLYFCLFHFRLQCEMGPWFAYGGSISDSLHYRALTKYIVSLTRWYGFNAPRIEHLPPNDFTPVAAWIAAQKEQGKRCTLQAVASVGVRVGAAAREQRLDISGTLFLSGGEPLTAGKRKAVEAAGMEVHPSYWITEIGQIGHSCRRMTSGNQAHVFLDEVAVIRDRRTAPYSDRQVDSLLFTSLLPHCPHVLINAEMQDSGTLIQTDCDCVFSRLGFTTAVRDISSYGKLTGHGMTLVGTDVLEILEEQLPARFGGSAADYQLVEQEAERQTELILRVSPRVGASAADTKEFFMRALKDCYGGALASRVWGHANALRVEIAEPLRTKAGKMMALHLGGPPR